MLVTAIERYFEKIDHYPERVLVDQIYSNPVNRAFCKAQSIRILGLALGRLKVMSKDEKKLAYRDYTDRIEVERGFSLAKRCYGLGMIKTKLDTTTCSSIALSIIAMNLDRLTADSFYTFLILMISRYICRSIPAENSTDDYSWKTAAC